MEKTIVLVSGANRGIGLEIVRALYESDEGPYHIYMGCRDLSAGQDAVSTLLLASSSKPKSTNNVGNNNSSITALQLDITSPASVSAAVATIAREQGGGGSGRLDVLINNAGVHLDEMADASERMRAVYEVNVVGTARLTNACRELLLRENNDNDDNNDDDNNSNDNKESKESKESNNKKIQKRIINLTSELGSITKRLDPSFISYGEQYVAYRCSKAALGMLTACQAYEFNNNHKNNNSESENDDADSGVGNKVKVKVSAFDPGWAATEFVTDRLDQETMLQMGAVHPSVSGRACRDIVEGRRDGDEDRDMIVRIRGERLPW